MNINICEIDYTIEDKVSNLLDILFYIKENKNNSLAFRSGCRSGVCGSCGVKVNGVEKLACKTNIEDNDSVKALDNIEVI
ncbi:MAG: 2Fe-2S iron-sulfur cluster-binding protein, partial [Campylobacterota bacterium]|nr:2Fe-2S iron-sulfur cluster-binding protein [Campylobacterota bacterium]